jgi:hypothetical protein
MRSRGAGTLGAAIALLFAWAGIARADVTLGSTAQPSGSTPGLCFTNADDPSENDVVVQLTSGTSPTYTVPAGGETIREWGTNTTGDTPATPLTLVVLRPSSGGGDTVVGADSETLPGRLFTDEDAVFTIAHPIDAKGGDELALYSSASGGAEPPVCYWDGGSTSAADGLDSVTEPGSPAAGQTLSEDIDMGQTGPSFTLDLAVNQNQDAGVTTAAPTAAAAHRAAVLSSTVSNAGPTVAPITFVDDVPAGLKLDSAVAGKGACAISGHKVTCTIDQLAAGQSVPVDVVVTPAARGFYVNHVTATAAALDPNAANDQASSTLGVTALAVDGCVVPRLGRTPVTAARTVLTHLGCRVEVTQQHSRAVHAGNVIETRPGPGHYRFETRIELVVSSGRR